MFGFLIFSLSSFVVVLLRAVECFRFSFPNRPLEESKDIFNTLFLSSYLPRRNIIYNLSLNEMTENRAQVRKRNETIQIQHSSFVSFSSPFSSFYYFFFSFRCVVDSLTMPSKDRPVRVDWVVLVKKDSDSSRYSPPFQRENGGKKRAVLTLKSRIVKTHEKRI